MYFRMITIIVDKTRAGRRPGIITYTPVVYNSKEYIVGTVLHNESDIQFVFDKDDYEKVSQRAWHLSANKYIASTFYTTDTEKNKKELFLHNFVMNRLDFPGKGAKETIDHINRNGLDNRKENLRILTQSEQNINQTKRQRSITLPDRCGIKPEEIPRHILYIKAYGAHGDRFGIKFKIEGITWKSSSSRKKSLIEKLQEAKVKLQEYYKDYTYLNPFNEEGHAQREILEKSFQEILQLIQYNMTQSL